MRMRDLSEWHAIWAIPGAFICAIVMAAGIVVVGAWIIETASWLMPK